MKLSIIVVNWNTCTLLEACLRSLEPALAPGAVEVLVVDNASTDGSAEMVRRQFPWAQLFVRKENTGYGSANNFAYRHSQGEYILLLNQDTLVPEGAVATLAQRLDVHSRVGAVGPRLRSPDGSLQPSIHPAPTVFREAWRLLHLDRIFPVSQYPRRWLSGEQERMVEVVMGSCMLIRRQVIEQVGLFDEQFFMYSEEVDLCKRIRAAGWSILFTPRASVIHYGGQSTAQMADEMFIELYRNKVRYFRKHAGRSTAGWYQQLLTWISIPRILLAWVVPLLPERRRARAREISRQYRRLLGEIWRF